MSNFIKICLILVALIIIFGLGLHHLGIIQVPAQIVIGSFSFKLYGLIATVAILLVAFLAYKVLQSLGLINFDVINLSAVTVLFGLVGARLYFVVTNWSQFYNQPTSIFYVWQGGLGIIGGLVFGGAAAYIYLKRAKVNPLPVITAVAIFIPLGQAIGRVGNLINHELFGFATNLPWAMYVPANLNPYSNVNIDLYFHPLYLYEAILNLILCYFLFNVYKKIGLQKIIIVYYALGYGLIRFLMDFGKPYDVAPTLAQVIAVIIWVIYFGSIIYKRKQKLND